MCIKCNPKFKLQNSSKNISWIIYNVLLELLAAEFKINSKFVEVFIWFVLNKNKNLYSLCKVSGEKFTQYFKQRQGYIHTQYNKTFCKNMFTIEETNCKQTHKHTVAISVINRSVCYTLISLDHRYNLVLVMPS